MTISDEQVCAYFGSEPSSATTNDVRPFRKGVWSSSSQDDMDWGRSLVEHHESTTRKLLLEARMREEIIADDSKIMIPKAIHFIWLGPRPIPQNVPPAWHVSSSSSSDEKEDRCSNQLEWNECMKSWRKNHPEARGWQIKLWTEAEAQSTFLDDSSSHAMLNREGYEYALRERNYGLASDILRLEILFAFGGVYADIDYLCISSLDDLHQAADFYCGASNVGCIELNNGLVGCTAKHALLKRMMVDIHKWVTSIISKECIEEKSSTSAESFLSPFLDASTAESLANATKLSHDDVIRHSGPGLITTTLMNSYSDESFAEIMKGVLVLPASFFHHFPNHLRKSISDHKDVNSFVERFNIENETKAIHLWGCSWQ